MNLSQTLIRALKDQGAGEVFGIPGDFILPFFSQLEQSGILPLVTLSHEPAIGFAADAAARMRCRPSVVAVTYGAGALNAVNAIAGAYAERSPVFVIAGCPSDAERGSGFLLHHQARTLDSQYQIFREITCDQGRITDAATAPAIIARLIRSCITWSQPVLLELPRDLANLEIDAVPSLPPLPFEPAAVDACAREILSRLHQARQPMLVVDVEIRRYQLESEVAELARRLNIPVVTTLMGRGLLAETEVQVSGTYLGEAGDPTLSRLVETSDGLLLLGVILSDSNFGPSSQRFDVRKAMLASHRAVHIGYHSYHDIPLSALVAQLLELLPASSQRPTKKNRTAHPSVQVGLSLLDDSQTLSAADMGVGIADLLAQAGEPMPVASDIGDCLFSTLDVLNTPLVAPGYYASMGFGVPAGLGIQLATGQRPLILVGDGAFQMTGWELGNCRRLGLDPIVVLFNNQSWEMIRVFSPTSQCSDLGDWQYARLANDLGGLGIRVRTRSHFRYAIREALSTRGQFVLIECVLPSGEVSPALQRFAETLQQKRTAAGA
ncbi:indolepyruvate/phenylpyruvate decarboxylase [Natronospirillum operosum]|uniref:Indolepyruvate/phenylpyruvate decarboxylase n=1 Tax=Natronospirillum operosum TaxID=2759953 RepID=A0A4Z0WF08_9GAMM|nr:indolepyruvate/phenylpyruvate decarboxylase [Natronospirillum operosum]TGG92916.1 indolepyruvate/phenylpyruvate decarboxylase [Natronospirillum operosum]